MEALNVLTEESLYRFLEQHGDSRVKRELLAFWGRHPNAKFSKRVLCYTLDCNKLDAERTLRAMVEAGLLDKHISNSVTLYSLTTNEDSRRPILALATLGWDRWQLMIKRVERRDKASLHLQP